MSSHSESQAPTVTVDVGDDTTDEELSVRALAEQVEALTAEVEALRDANDQLEQTVEAQATQLDEQARELDAMEARIDELVEAQAASNEHRKHLQGRLHALESENSETDESSDDDDGNDPSTPLGRILQLPKQLIQQKLSANQQRALLIAKDIREYADRVPAGFAIKSGTIRKVLQAKEDRTPHTQTIARVMEFLDRLGKEHVRVVKRRGTKRVVFTETAVDRLGEVARTSSRGNEERSVGSRTL